MGNALRAAAAMVTRCSSAPTSLFSGSAPSHIPKRAVQHGIFRSYAEIPLTSLKTGQMDSRDRTLYSAEANALSTSHLSINRPHTSDYVDQTCKAREGTAFERKTRFASAHETKAKQGDPNYGNYSGTAHWRSEYKSVMDDASIAGATHHRQHGPSFQAFNPTSCLTSGPLMTTAHVGYGKYGSRPRDMVSERDRANPTSDLLLKKGTTKGSLHLPSYSGFLPTNTANPLCAKIAVGGGHRMLDKHVLSDQFNSRLVGYAGHKPATAKNDRGGVAVSSLTSTGAGYRAPMLNAFD